MAPVTQKRDREFSQFFIDEFVLDKISPHVREIKMALSAKMNIL